MKGGGQQTVNQTVDPGTQAYVNQMRQLALGYAGLPGTTGTNPAAQNAGQYLQGRGGMWGGIGDQLLRQGGGTPGAVPNAPALPQNIQDAISQYGQYAQGGNLGFSALTGNAGAQQQFQNPYLSQFNPFFAQQRQQAVEGANQQATLAGAFGGDRSQIGAATAGNLADQTQAGFNYQAFQDAMQRAQFASQLGFGATGLGAFLPQQYQQGQLNLLGSAIGPYGQTQTQQMHRDPFSQLLGLGATVGGFLLGGPPGAAAGSQLGGGAGYNPLSGNWG